MISATIPRYLYERDQTPRRNDGALFHFTNSGSFFDILDDLTLRPSYFTELNDLNEGNIHNIDSHDNFRVVYKSDEYIKKQCRVLCFSQNYDVHGLSCEGTNHPAMWAHYGEKSKGACVVIDKSSFVEENKAVLDKCFHKFENVEYRFLNTAYEAEIDYKVNDSQKFIMCNWKPLFFLKHKDWENEDEHRLFIIGYEGKFSIANSIKHIVLGKYFHDDKDQMKKLLDRIVNPSSACYHKFIPHSFACSSYNTSGYITYEIPGRIMEIVKANLNDENYVEYLRWLKSDAGYIV